ncbi:hypothetical protein [Thermomonospora sp. CIF 1]|uniref:VMAP-C domain-containing protein n=1 Tax=Thermomonospora sp. CIF 1 TaxID=1916083 RepID=UPI002580ABD3|nr:hypothetical protein [Thermomonospora sp. CIF 1]
MAWSPDFEEQLQLVRALLEVEGMRRQSDRDLYIQLLEDALGHYLPFARDERPLYDVMHLVRACLAYPGAIQTLVKIVEQVCGDSRAVRRVKELVEQLFPEPLLTFQERSDLHRIVRESAEGGFRTITPALVADLYRKAVEPLGPPLHCDPGDLSEVLAQLEELTSGLDGVPPLLVFVENLAARVAEPTASALRSWADRFADRLELAPEAKGAVRERAVRALEGTVPAAESAGPYSYLIIEFRPDAITADHYLTSAWLQCDGEHGVMLHCDDEDPLPRHRLQEVIEKLLADPQVVNRPHTELMVEFVLPRVLLDVPFDQIQINIEGLTRRLGIEYPVVVRSFDRMRSRTLHHNWRRKWNWLRGNPTRASLCRLPVRSTLGHELLYNNLLEESSIGVAMSFPPSAEREKTPDELWVSLHAGIPIAVWCRRRESDPGSFFTEVQQLWDQGVFSLPQSVLQLRRKALRALEKAPADDHLGFQLTLMFDDADRLPEPYVRLSAPA